MKVWAPAAPLFIALVVAASGCGGRSEAELRYAVGLAYANRARAYTILGRDAESQQDVDRAVELGFDPAVLRAESERLKKLR